MTTPQLSVAFRVGKFVLQPAFASNTTGVPDP